jgi:hypothetical protein
MQKFPPIPIRDRGGHATINNPDDGTPIREQFVLGDGLLMVTDKCTYRIQLADQIDPKRQNPDLAPLAQQRLFDHGVQSELLTRTLLQSKVLFRKEFQSTDIDTALQLSFDALCELVAMDDIAKEFAAAQHAAITKVERMKQKDASLILPSIGNTRSLCKSYIQKADHLCQSLRSILPLFYPEMKTGNWDDFQKIVLARYGSEDMFSKVMELAVPVLKLIRNTRNCLDHRHLSGVDISDFSPLPNGTVELPSIEIDYNGSVHDRCPIEWFMKKTATSLLDIFEMIVVHICSKHCQPLAGFPMYVGHLPENYRDAWHVRFAYGMRYEGQVFVPCG